MHSDRKLGLNVYAIILNHDLLFTWQKCSVHILIRAYKKLCARNIISPQHTLWNVTNIQL